jgi:hypothetical protein
MMGSNQIGGLSIRPLPSMIPEFATDQAILTGRPDKFGFGFALNIERPSPEGEGFWVD